MRSAIVAIGLAAFLSASLPAAAQQQPADTGWRMPYESGFWGHAGISAGRADIDGLGCAPGTACDTEGNHVRAYAGGRFNNAFGLEVGAMNFGNFTINGGEADGWGVDVALVAGLPIGDNSAVFAKAGFLYSDMEVEGAVAGFPNGKESGFGPRIGIGGQLGLGKNWALRADLDRYRLDFPGGREEDIDAVTVGVQYTFR
jgi:hypothetical protein